MSGGRGELDYVRLGQTLSGWDSVVDGAISGRARQCSAGPNNVRSGVSVKDRFGKDLELINLIIFISSNMPLLVVRCSYTQEI
jgi:hypothetical protein